MRSFRFSWILHFFFLLFALTIVYLPLSLHARRAPEHTSYSYWQGELPDYYQYLSYIHQGRTQWQLTGAYTSEELPRTYVHGWYLFLGKIGRITGLSDIGIYHLSVAGSILLSYVFTWKLAAFLLTKRVRWIAMTLVYFASPPKPMTIPIFNIAIGTGNWTKMDTYSRLAQVPHHGAALALMIGSVYYLLHFLKHGNRRSALFCAFCLTISMLAFAVPGLIFLCALFLFFPVMGIRFIRSRLTGLAWISLSGLTALSFAWYQLHLAGWGGWEYQQFHAEQWPYLFSVFLSSYGFTGVLFLCSLFFLREVLDSTSLRRHFSANFFFIVLLTLIPPLCYLLSVWGMLPITKIRFMYANPYVFASIGAVIGLNRFMSRRIAVAILAVIACLFFSVGIHAYWLPKLAAYPQAYQNVYIPKKYMLLMSYLDHSVSPHSTVLAPYEIATFIPSFATVNVFAGHPYAFYLQPQKQKLLTDFYAGAMSAEDATELFRRHDLRYVLWKTTPLPEQYTSVLIEEKRWEDVILYKIVMPVKTGIQTQINTNNASFILD